MGAKNVWEPTTKQPFDPQKLRSFSSTLYKVKERNCMIFSPQVLQLSLTVLILLPFIEYICPFITFRLSNKSDKKLASLTRYHIF